jgi:hypothetical protein
MSESNEPSRNPLVSFSAGSSLAGGGLGGLLGVLMANLHDHAVLWALVVLILVSEAMLLLAFIVWKRPHVCDSCKRSNQRRN